MIVAKVMLDYYSRVSDLYSKTDDRSCYTCLQSLIKWHVFSFKLVI